MTMAGLPDRRISSAVEHKSGQSTPHAMATALLDAAPDAIVVADRHGEIVLSNLQAERQFGYRRHELIGEHVTRIIPGGLADAGGTAVELAARRKDASQFSVELTMGRLEDPDGPLAIAIMRDTGARKKTETDLRRKVEELTRSNEELGQFAYIASHDLQEPLRMVASYTQLLSRRYKGKLDADADEFIAFAVDGANRMQRLIQDLLAYSRIGTNANGLEAISSEEALDRALTNLRGAIEEKRAEITHGPLPPVMEDEGQLTQLFQNLVGNAIKYQKPGFPNVHIAAEKDGKNWVFSVKDNGLGIEPRHFEKIFGMFQRLHNRQEFAGTGIGLAICKKIVERHGGSISIESHPGQGSIFRFVLAGAEK
jgi:PAS domain S-box-containing protein